MPTPIEQALITLVPSLNTLPPELLNLATALLSQSTSKASVLKPEEEIGRVYACAHIACERLQARLGLDKLQPRPPVPPRIYKKLHAFLDSQLLPTTPRTTRFVDAVTPTSGATRTPTSRRTVNGTPLSKRIADPDDTPSRRSEKRPRLVPDLPPTTETDEPLAIDSMIASLATAYTLQAPTLRSAATPHLSPDLGPERTAGLLVAIAILQSTSSRTRALTTDEFVSLRDKGLSSLGREDDADVLAAVKEWLRTAGLEGWVASWAKKQAQTPLRRKEKHAAAPSPAGDGIGPAGLVVGLGSMFQDAVDWLAEERRGEYEAWDRDVRLRIHDIMAQGG